MYSYPFLNNILRKVLIISAYALRAVEFALTEAGTQVTSYHGDLNSKEREKNLQRFRDGLEKVLAH